MKCENCNKAATVYAMGANAGDWAGYYCDSDIPKGFNVTNRLASDNRKLCGDHLVLISDCGCKI